MRMSSPNTLENVVYEKKGAIAYVTLNRPKVLNALNRRTWEDLRTAFEDARDDAAVRGVILTGAGDKAFIAGADINELARVTAIEAEEASSFGQAVLNLIENLGKPAIAVKFSLEAVNKGLETSQAEGLSLEASFFGLCAGTDDKKEGTQAFLQKRAPQFQGR